MYELYNAVTQPLTSHSQCDHSIGVKFFNYVFRNYIFFPTKMLNGVLINLQVVGNRGKSREPLKWMGESTQPEKCAAASFSGTEMQMMASLKQKYEM